MAVDFSSLLNKPAGKALKPAVLPAGDYKGVIKGREFGDNNQNHTPYVRFFLGLMEWPESIAESERGQLDDSGQFHPTDLSKKSLRRDFYYTEDALWRLDELIKSCGIDPAGRTYGEIVEELIGQHVTVEVQQYLNQKTNELGNQVGRLVGGQSSRRHRYRFKSASLSHPHYPVA